MSRHGSATRSSSASQSESGGLVEIGFDDFDGSEWIKSLVPAEESNMGFGDDDFTNFAYPSQDNLAANQSPGNNVPYAAAVNTSIPSSAPDAVEIIDPALLFSGIRQDAFVGLDDSARRASMQLLNGSNFALPQDNAQEFQAYPEYDPHSNAAPYFHSTGYGQYQDFGAPPAPAMVDPMLAYNDGYLYTQPTTNVSNERKRPFNTSDEEDEGAPRKRRTRTSISSGRSSEGTSSLPSYTSSRRSDSGSSGSSQIKTHRSRNGYKQVESRASAFVEFKPEKPKVDESKPWIRTNNTTKGLTSRTGKINNYNPGYKICAHPVGTWTGKKTTFEYTEHGEIKAHTLTANQIYEFMTHYPMNKAKRQRLILWIQKAPTDSARRFPTHTWSTCRFAGCPNRNSEWTDKPQGSIIHGHYRVAFDEKWIKYGTESDPNLPSFYVHLYCMEKFLDLPFLVQKSGNFDIRVDRRSISTEPGQRWAPSLDRQPEVVIAEDYVTGCKDNTLRNMTEFKHYPYHDPRKRGEDQNKPFRKSTLTYWMNHYKRNSRPPAQFSQFADRRFKPSNILVNNGDLEMAYWDIRNTIAQSSGTKKARKAAKKAKKMDEDDSMFPAVYREDPELVAIYNDLMPLYESKMRGRKQRAPRQKSKVTNHNRRGSEDWDNEVDHDNDDEASDEEPDVHYDPQAEENDSDADDDFQPRRGKDTQGSRRSARVQKFQAEGKLPQTYAEADNQFIREEAHVEPGFDWDGELAAIQRQTQYQSYQPAPTGYMSVTTNFDAVNHIDPTLDSFDFDADLSSTLPGGIDASFAAELEAEAAKLEQNNGGELDEQTIKDLGLDLYRRRSTVDLPVKQIARLASIIKLNSPVGHRKRSVTFGASESETQTFSMEEPPVEVGRSRRSKHSLSTSKSR